MFVWGKGRIPNHGGELEGTPKLGLPVWEGFQKRGGAFLFGDPYNKNSVRNSVGEPGPEKGIIEFC